MSEAVIDTDFRVAISAGTLSRCALMHERSKPGVLFDSSRRTAAAGEVHHVTACLAQHGGKQRT